jgi:hypothetical protein
MLDIRSLNFHTKSKLNSIEVFAVIFHLAFLKDRARATFSQICTQGARYFETRKVIFVDKMQKPIKFLPKTVLILNSYEPKPDTVAAYKGFPLIVRMPNLNKNDMEAQL